MPSKQSLIMSPRQRSSKKSITKYKSVKKETNILRARIDELEDIIAVMDGDREALRAKIE